VLLSTDGVAGAESWAVPTPVVPNGFSRPLKTPTAPCAGDFPAADWLGDFAVVERMVADFYEVPRDRLGELRDAAQGGRASLGRNREHWNAMLSSLRRPAPRYESPHYYLAAVFGVVGDAPLPDGEEMLGDDSPAYQDLLLALVESRGGGWEIIEPSAARIAALDPRAFDAERLRAHYAGEVDYYPGEDEEEADEPGSLGELFDRLFPAGAQQHPADAGEQMLRDILLLRTALTNISDDSVLLIHMP
jgi:hypothetical protein